MADIELQGDDDLLELSSVNFSSDDEVSFKKNKGKQKKIKKPKAKKPAMSFAPKASFKPQAHNPPPPTQQEDFEDDTFEAFSNPQKKFETQPGIEKEDDNDDDDDVSLPSFDEEPQMDNTMGGDGMPSITQPSPGFKTIEDEKQDIIYKFYRLEAKGYKLSRKFNMQSDIIEMRSELNRIKRDTELKSSLKFSRRMLMACVSGIEFLNKTYDPFTLELNGWSENVMENLNEGDFDNVFERLHDKYSGKVNTPPEMELMLSLAGSALMFHITSTMFKNVQNVGGGMDPSMLKNMMSQMQSNKQSEQDGGMKPPPVDLSNMSSMFGNMFPNPPMQTRDPRPERPASPAASIMSDDSAISDGIRSMASERIKNVALSEGTALKKRGRKSKIEMNDKNTINLFD